MSIDPVMNYFERMEEDLLPVDKIEKIKQCRLMCKRRCRYFSVNQDPEKFAKTTTTL